MSNLRDIRRRLKSIENIKKITDAMERISAARLRRVQLKTEQSRPYTTHLKKIVEKIAATGVDHPLFKEREVKKIGIIVITSDKGLCGSYNTNILSTAGHFLKKYPHHKVELLLFGNKAIDYYKRKSFQIRHQLSGWAGKITFQNVKSFSDQLIDWFLKEELDEVWMVYTRFINIIRHEVVVDKVLNLKTALEKDKISSLDYIYEPDPTEFLPDLLPKYCATLIQMALDEAYASELAARVIAMRAASKNSEEVIERLTMVRNKKRQEGITNGVIEVTSGAEYLT